MILADHQIDPLARAGMIENYEPRQWSEHAGPDGSSYGVFSYGRSSHGYDCRLGRNVLYLAPGAEMFDAKRPNPDHFISCPIQRTARGEEYITLLPHACVLGTTVERWRLPRDIIGLVVGKSTWARAFIHVLATPMEPGWGMDVDEAPELTLEIVNMSGRTQPLYIGEGIAQVLFFRGEPCERSYADKRGKYQRQVGPTLGRM